MRAYGAGKATREMNRLRSTNSIQSERHCPHTGDGAESPPIGGDSGSQGMVMSALEIGAVWVVVHPIEPLVDEPIDRGCGFASNVLGAENSGKLSPQFSGDGQLDMGHAATPGEWGDSVRSKESGSSSLSRGENAG
jgi:hypothetical protein